MRRISRGASGGGLIFPETQADLSGRATVEGTQRMERRFGLMDYRSIPRSGWRVSRLGFGGDDLGGRPNDRAKLMGYLVQRRGVNVIEVDVDAMHARHDPASRMQERSPQDRDWERRALLRLVGRSGASRDELVVIATVGCGSLGPSAAQRRGPDAVTAGPESVVERVRQAAEWMGLDGFDIVLANVPASEKDFGPVAMADTVQVLEQGLCREEALSQGWGIACAAFSPLEQGSALDHAGRPLAAQPLSRILSEAAAAAQRAGDTGEQHRMLAVRYLASVTNPAPFVPAVVDDGGREWSVSEVLQQLHIAQLLKGPLDSVKHGRVFRAVDADDHQPLDGRELSEALTEQLSYALHLETMFDKDVADEARRELGEMRAEWQRARDEALANELAKLPEFSKERGPGETPAERNRRIREMVAQMSEAHKAEAAERLAKAVREAERRRAGPGPALSSSAGAGGGPAGPDSPGLVRPSDPSRPVPSFTGHPQERKTVGMGFAAAHVKPGVRPLEAPPPPEMPAAEDAAWGRVIANNVQRLHSLSEFRYFWATRVEHGVLRVIRALGATKECRDWAKAYQATMQMLGYEMTRFLEAQHAVRARTVARMLDAALPEAAPPADWMTSGGWASDALHERVLRIMAGTPADVILSEVGEFYGVKRPGSFGRIRGRKERILPPPEEVVSLERTQAALRGADIEHLLSTMVPDSGTEEGSARAVQAILDTGTPEAEFLWDRMSDTARKLYTFPSREDRAAKMVEQDVERQAAASGRTVVDGSPADERR